MRTPAFPAMHYDLADNEHGLTMRDYFAAKAMQGLVENANWRGMPEHSLAKEAYKLADEMMKARES